MAEERRVPDAEESEAYEGEGEADDGGREHPGSRVDALGHEKRRQVVGKTYGPTRRRQLAYYGAFLAFLVVVYIVASIAISQLDKPPAHQAAAAPWAKPGAPKAPLGGFSTDTRGGVTRFQ